MLLLALSFAKFTRGRLVAPGYLSIALLTTLVFGAWFGWVPDVVVVLSYLVLAGGLLLGPRFVYGLGLALALLLCLGGLLLRTRSYAAPTELDPAAYQPWLRTALGFAVLTGAAAWVVLEAAEGVLRAQTQAARSLALARERLQETEASRARRLQQEQALLDAQKLQSVGAAWRRIRPCGEQRAHPRALRV